MQLMLLTLQLVLPETLQIRSIEPPVQLSQTGFSRLGHPQIAIHTRQGTARVWLLRLRDSVFVLASVPDSTPYWGDDFVVSLDTRGDAAPSPEHDDFQLYFRRALDSSVVFRGRNGRWEPPRSDPDWRLGRDRAGGGWEVDAESEPAGWRLLLRLDPAWFRGEGERRPRIAFRIYNNDPSGWYAWPPPRGSSPHSSVEQAPSLWMPVK